MIMRMPTGHRNLDRVDDAEDEFYHTIIFINFAKSSKNFETNIRC